MPCHSVRETSAMSGEVLVGLWFGFGRVSHDGFELIATTRLGGGG
ncbi:MAG: hypothetical protein Q8K82_01190 [Gemmatimonadaceae bacterium]|nr:hypothetical protein [Gemmatimonadaceae bacterium]